MRHSWPLALPARRPSGGWEMSDGGYLCLSCGGMAPSTPVVWRVAGCCGWQRRQALPAWFH
jgi:hypothetical protein